MPLYIYLANLKIHPNTQFEYTFANYQFQHQTNMSYIVSFLTLLKWALDFLINHMFFHHRVLQQQKETYYGLGMKRFNYDEEVECAVCLRKIEDDDETRELRCDHLFHISCLDSWFSHRHTTCPLCRDDLVPSPPNISSYFHIQTWGDFTIVVLFWGIWLLLDFGMFMCIH